MSLKRKKRTAPQKLSMNDDALVQELCGEPILPRASSTDFVGLAYCGGSIRPKEVTMHANRRCD